MPQPCFLLCHTLQRTQPSFRLKAGILRDHCRTGQSWQHQHWASRFLLHAAPVQLVGTVLMSHPISVQCAALPAFHDSSPSAFSLGTKDNDVLAPGLSFHFWTQVHVLCDPISVLSHSFVRCKYRLRDFCPVLPFRPLTFAQLGFLMPSV